MTPGYILLQALAPDNAGCIYSNSYTIMIDIYPTVICHKCIDESSWAPFPDSSENHLHHHLIFFVRDCPCDWLSLSIKKVFTVNL